MSNLYRALLDLLPQSPLQTATVIAVDNSANTSLVQWDGGSTQSVRGVSVPVGGRAFIRDGAIESTAPNLVFETIEI